MDLLIVIMLENRLSSRASNHGEFGVDDRVIHLSNFP
jgi:hypothetical protein